MRSFKSRRIRLFAAVSATVALGLAVFAGLGSSETLSTAAAQYGPTNQSPPSITGAAQVGSGLAATTGSWQGNIKSYSYQWQLCDQNGNGCKTISGATSNGYTVASNDVGGRIRVAVTAHDASGAAATAVSAPTGVVAAASGGSSGGGTGSCQGSGTVNVKDISPPIRLLVDKWQFSPSVVNRSAQTVVARVHIADTCNHSVAGALVWGTAIPYNQLTTEQGTTGSDGYVTLTFRVKSGFPANPGRQQIMAMLFRATDPGGSVLAGKSTRRVVSLPVNSR